MDVEVGSVVGGEGDGADEIFQMVHYLTRRPRIFGIDEQGFSQEDQLP